jgi:hypothetical protein
MLHVDKVAERCEEECCAPPPLRPSVDRHLLVWEAFRLEWMLEQCSLLQQSLNELPVSPTNGHPFNEEGQIRLTIQTDLSDAVDIAKAVTGAGCGSPPSRPSASLRRYLFVDWQKSLAHGGRLRDCHEPMFRLASRPGLTRESSAGGCQSGIHPFRKVERNV